MKNKKTNRLLKLRGKTCVFIDWANVHGWNKSLEREVDPKKLFTHLKSYKEISEIRLYYGTDINPKSRQFIKQVKQLGYQVTTKPVKYIDGKRKCDFDMEICLEVHEVLVKFECFVFFTGDGDFAPLYTMLLARNKQVITIFAHGHLGREVAQLSGVYRKAVDRLRANIFGKKIPPRFPKGRDYPQL